MTMPSGLCSDCLFRLEKAIKGLPADVLTLTSIMGPGSGGLSAKVSGTRELQLNIRPGLFDLRAAIDYEVGYWAQVLGMALPEAVRLPERVARACRWLAPRVGPLVALGPYERPGWTHEGEAVEWADLCDGLGGALELMNLHHRVRWVAGRTRLVHRLTPACAHCNHRALVRQNGGDRVECEHCGNNFPEDQYDWFVRVTLGAVAGSSVAA